MTNERWRTGKTLVNGITVAYDDVGEGDNVLVLVHGHPFNRTMWRPQMQWIEGFNRARPRARARARLKSEDGMSNPERLGNDNEVELATR
jgi:hypothetical protein